MMSIKEHDLIVLTDSLPEHGLEAGDVGTVVHVYEDDAAFEVEFIALDGETCAVVTLTRAQLRPGRQREITHARRMA